MDATVNLGEELAQLLSTMEGPLDQSARELIVLELYRRAAISAGYGAGLLGMEKLAFIRWSGEMGIPYLRYSPDELDRELETLRAMRPS